MPVFLSFAYKFRIHILLRAFDPISSPDKPGFNFE